MADTWTTWASAAIEAVRERAGDGTICQSGPLLGRRLPRTSAIDSIAVLGQVSPSIVAAVKRLSKDGVAWNSTLVGGAFVRPIGMVPLDEKRSIDASAYVAGYGAAREAWKRSPTGADAAGVLVAQGETYEPALDAAILGSEETELLSALRSLLQRWQEAVNASAALVRLSAADLARPLTGTIVDAFWLRVYAIAVQLEILAENPPASRLDRVRGAIDSAVEKSATFAADTAGAAAARVAELAGQTAGAFTESFLGSASLLSLLVAGVAVYWFVG